MKAPQGPPSRAVTPCGVCGAPGTPGHAPCSPTGIQGLPEHRRVPRIQLLAGRKLDGSPMFLCSTPRCPRLAGDWRNDFGDFVCGRCAARDCSLEPGDRP